MADDSAPVQHARFRHHWFVRATHWLSAVLLVGMIASGLQLYAASPHFGEKGNVYPVPNPFDSDTGLAAFPKPCASGAGWPAG